ncbi:hypothetical protein B0H12DRAFT_83645 [Mycena haematopus]|nr:hypothetical protein B0H12DRAFT_83645 [Mycena haematopus]
MKFATSFSALLVLLPLISTVSGLAVPEGVRARAQKGGQQGQQGAAAAKAAQAAAASKAAAAKAAAAKGGKGGAAAAAPPAAAAAATAGNSLQITRWTIFDRSYLFSRRPSCRCRRELW